LGDLVCTYQNEQKIGKEYQYKENCSEPQKEIGKTWHSIGSLFCGDSHHQLTNDSPKTPNENGSIVFNGFFHLISPSIYSFRTLTQATKD